MFIVDFLVIIPEFFLIISISFLIIFNVIIWPLSSTLVGFYGSFFESLSCIRQFFFKNSSFVLSKNLLVFNFLERQKTSLQSLRVIFSRNLWLAILILIITFFLCFNFGSFFYSSLIYIDTYVSYVKLFILFIAVLFFIFMLGSDRGPFIFEAVILILCSLLGLFCLLSSYDLLFFYLGLELQSFCLYLLASLKRNSEFSVEAGLKYFILGAFASGLLLFGCSLIYGFSGSTNFGSLQIFFSSFFLHSIPFVEFSGFYLGFIFIFIGLLFKLTVAPFHIWAIDVYEGSPFFVTCFFSIIPKFILFSFFFRFFFCVCFGFTDSFFLNSFFFYNQPLILICSFCSMVVGTVGGLYQRKIKRLLAYSTIAHVGYILLGCSSGNLDGLQAVFIYLFFYIAASLGVFCILLSIKFLNFYSLDGGLTCKLKNFSFLSIYITDLFYIFRSNYLLGFFFSVFFFSMAGVPPLGGFFGKFYVFLVSFNAGFYVLTFVAVFTSIIGCFYYLRLVKLLYFSSLGVYKVVDKNICISISFFSSFLIVYLFIFLIGFIFYPGPILYFSYSLVLELLY